jgi:hypothetical protein
MCKGKTAEFEAKEDIGTRQQMLFNVYFLSFSENLSADTKHTDVGLLQGIC